MATINEIAEELKTSKQPITLIYAFNSTGKTKLSVEYKNITKKEDGKHSGVYYNAYSEDLFRWDNDELNGNENMRLEILKSSLNPYSALLLKIQTCLRKNFLLTYQSTLTNLILIKTLR
jgi:hypothetical protein